MFTLRFTRLPMRNNETLIYFCVCIFQEVPGESPLEDLYRMYMENGFKPVGINVLTLNKYSFIFQKVSVEFT